MAAVINNPLSSNQINILVIKNIPCTNQVLLVKICYYLRKMINDGVLTLTREEGVGWLARFFFLWFILLRVAILYKYLSNKALVYYILH